MNSRELAINRTLTDLEAAVAPAYIVDELELQAVQDLVREVVFNSNHPQRVREFFSTFVQDIVVSGSTIDVHYRKDRSVAVHSDSEWLPDLGSNQGPAD